MCYIRFTVVVLMLTSKMSIAQKELKQQWYLQFHVVKDSTRNKSIDFQRVHTDVLGNTFIYFTSMSTFEFQGKVDSGRNSHIYKVDPKGIVLWSKTFKHGLENHGGAALGISPDNKGGVFVRTNMGQVFNLSNDSTYRNTIIKYGVIHWGSNGEFLTLSLLDKVEVGNIHSGLDSNLYFTKDDDYLYILDKTGKIKSANYPYNNGVSAHFAANKFGDVASIETLWKGESFTIGDTTYKATKSYSYVLVVRDSTAKLKWHSFYENRGFLDLDDNHSVRWDGKNNLFIALNINSLSPGFEKYVSGGQKTIIYKYDVYGNKLGEFFDTSSIEFSDHFSQTWLQNVENGDVVANIFTYKRYDTYYPGLTLKSHEIPGYMRVKFDDNFKVKEYYYGSSVPRMDNSNIGSMSVFWNVKELNPNQSKEYYLPNGQSVTCKYDSDFFVIMMDTTEPKQNGIAKLVQEQVHVSLEPNPLQLNNTLQVHSKVQPIRSVFVLDVKGNKLKEQLNVNLIKTSLLLDQKNGFKAGVYFVRIEFQNGESTTQKIVVTD